MSEQKKISLSDEIRELINEKGRFLRDKWRKIVTGDENRRIRDFVGENKKVQNIVNDLNKRKAEPTYIKLIDKLSFTFGVLNMSACQYFLLSHSDRYWIFYSVVIPILLFIRYFQYHRLHYEYFMLDFCYFNIFCSFLLLYLLRFATFFKLVFIFSNGPLMWAIVVWRNSIVFHDYEKITSVYIHILPCMLTYCLRWGTGSESIAYAQQPMYLRDYVFAALLYLFWQICYYVKTEIIDKDKLDSNPCKLTSLRWLASDKKNPLARAILNLLRKVGIFRADEDYDSKTVKTKIVFMASQFVYTVVTFSPTLILYYSSVLTIWYIFAIYAVAVFYGASYYIDVFSARYQLKFEKKAQIEEVVAAAAQVAFDAAELHRTAVVAQSVNSPKAVVGIPQTFSVPELKETGKLSRQVSFTDELTHEAASNGEVINAAAHDICEAVLRDRLFSNEGSESEGEDEGSVRNSVNHNDDVNVHED